MSGFRETIAAWRTADPKHIHPTREHETEVAYWQSGRTQAEVVLAYLPDGGTVVDFGCGDGRIAIPLAQLGFFVYAVDAAPEMLERLNHQAEVQGVAGIATVLSDGSNISELIAHGYLRTGVDAVNARAVFIHHAHPDVAMMVQNLASLLKPGGLLIADWPFGTHHERRDWIDVTTWDYDHRQQVATGAGLELVSEGEPKVRPSVWVKS